MAGDILLYQTDLVPIGDDQRQHLELARDVAERFNYRFGETFRVPEGQYPEIGGRIMDLQEPTNKMSTTLSSEQGAVYIVDSPDAIRKKFKSAVTDSGREVRYDPQEKPGVSNLLEIMSVATGEPIDALEQRFESAGYGDFKEAVGESVVELLTPIRERYEALRADERELQRLLAVGAEKARRAVGADARGDVRAHGIRPLERRQVLRCRPAQGPLDAARARHFVTCRYRLAAHVRSRDGEAPLRQCLQANEGRFDEEGEQFLRGVLQPLAALVAVQVAAAAVRRRGQLSGARTARRR